FFVDFCGINAPRPIRVPQKRTNREWGGLPAASESRIASVARDGERREIGEDQLPPDWPVASENLRALVDGIKDGADDCRDPERAKNSGPRKGAPKRLPSRTHETGLPYDGFAVQQRDTRCGAGT